MSGKPIDEAVRLLREYREAPKFSNDHDAIKRTVALEDEIDAFLAAITAVQQRQAAAEDMGGFTSDTAALAFLRLIGDGNPDVERAVDSLRSYQIAIGQQRPAVDAAMVERCTDAAIASSTQRYRGESVRDSWRRLVRDVLTAALATQQQEPTT